MLLFTMPSNLFISLRTAVRICLSQSILLDSKELESESSLEESLPSLRCILEALDLIFLVFLISRREPDFLEML